MKIRNIAIVAAIAGLTMTACDIERLPSTSINNETILGNPESSFDNLLNGAYSQLKSWSDVMHRCGEYAGDNIMIRGNSTDAFFEFISYARTPNNYRLQAFWDNSYKCIAQTSNIIKMFGDGNLDDAMKNSIGECYFLRGMLYFYLCRAYGRPYYQSPETKLGVPIVNGTPEDVFGELDNNSFPDRSTVADTYAQAIADLEKAAEMMTVNRGPAYASKEAAWALLSRIYLYMSGTYSSPNTRYAEKAVEYADKVINSGVYTMLTRDEFMGYNTIVPEENKESIFVVKRVASEFSGDEHYYGIGGMYSNIGGMGWGEMYASAKYIALLDETGRNDWYNGKIVDARAKFIEPQYDESGPMVFRFIKKAYQTDRDGTVHYDQQVGYNYVQAPVTVSADKTTASCEETISDQKNTYQLIPDDPDNGIWKIFYPTDNTTYTGYIDRYIKLNRVYPMFYIVKCSREGEDSQLHSPVITRLAEMYLNKAEALAKQGKYAEAQTALNVVRERSLPGEGYTDLAAGNAGERIDKERTLELAYQAERSYDVFRNGDALTRRYPGPHKAMEDVSATDYRVVYYIPQKAINSYPGTLTQNPTSN